MTNARHIPSAASIMMMANGSALAIVIVCKALSPPARSNAPATTPSVDAQNTRCQTGVRAAPPAASESITSEPESEEVTKNVMINSTAMNEAIDVSGSNSKSLNSATALSACTSEINEV